MRISFTILIFLLSFFSSAQDDYADYYKILKKGIEMDNSSKNKCYRTTGGFYIPYLMYIKPSQTYLRISNDTTQLLFDIEFYHGNAFLKSYGSLIKNGNKVKLIDERRDYPYPIELTGRKVLFSYFLEINDRKVELQRCSCKRLEKYIPALFEHNL